jgi:ligand-binding sensor domain-containing protein
MLIDLLELKHKIRAWISYLVLTACCMMGQSQTSKKVEFEPVMFRYTMEDGLPSNHIYDVFEDSRGFLWLGTEGGVSRYDGTEFENYHTADGLSGEEVLSIREDQKGRIWMMTFCGIPCFWSEGKFHNPQNTPFLKGIASESFLAAFEADAAGNVFLGYYDGAIFRIDSNEVVEKLVACTNLGCGVNLIAEDDHGGIVSTISSRDLWTWKNGKTGKIRISEVNLLGPENYPIKAILRSDGSLLYTWARQGFILEPGYKQTTFLDSIPGINAGKIIFLGEDRRKNLWVGTTKGAYRFGKGGRLTQPESKILPDQHISSVLQDSSGGYWIATRTGLWHIPNQGVRFASVSDDLISAAYANSNNHLLLGTRSGSLLDLEMQGMTLESTSIDPRDVDVPMRKITVLPDKTTLSIGDLGIAEYKSGSLLRKNAPALKDISIHPDQKRACVCMFSGWVEVDIDSIQKRFFGSRQIAERRLEHPGRCVMVRYDLSGRLWVVGSTGSTVVMDGHESIPESLQPYMEAGKITALNPDEHGGMWIGIDGRGMLHLNEEGASRWVKGFGREENPDLYAIFSAPNDVVWAATKRGLYLIAGDSATLKLPSSSLPNADILAVTDAHDHLMIATSQGLCLVSKSEMASPPVGPRPYLRRFSIADTDTLLVAPLQLDFNQNTVQFSFRGLGFQARGGIAYRYRLRGQEKDWQHTRGEVIRYSSLPAGTFQFELQARYEGESWSESLVLPPISIALPWWQTWWFYVLTGLILLGILTLIFWLILKSIRRRNHLLMSFLKAEHQALIVQMNPHFIFNALNSIQNYFLNDEKETANDFLADFSALIRSTLENSRSADVSLAEELKQLDLYLRLEAMRLEGRFSHHFEVDSGLNPQNLRIPSMLLQPILENAVWHGLAHRSGPGILNMSIQREGESLLVQIRDNGVGRKKSKELRNSRRSHKPLATEIMKERIAILNKMNKNQIRFSIEDLYAEDGQAAGTLVSLNIPITNSTEL